MTVEQLTEALLQIGAGAVAADDLSNDNTDVASIVAKVKEAQKKVLAPEFKGRFYSEFTGKMARAFKEAGLFPDDTTITELKEMPLDELVKTIDAKYNDRHTNTATTQQKSVQEQLETLKSSLTNEHKSAMAELQNQLKEYQSKETATLKMQAVKGSLPDGFTPNDLQLKAILNLLESEADIKFNNGKTELYHKGTDVAFGLLNEKKELLDIKNVLSKHAKELGVWSEKPTTQKLDASKLFKSANGGLETGNGVDKLPPHLQKNAKLQELAKQAFENAEKE